MALPRFIVMRSSGSGKYLQYGKGKASALGFSHEPERETLSSSEGLDSLKKKIAERTPLDFNLLKFEVEESKSVPGYVHIRTCYNRKYLMRKSEESKRLVAEGHEADEDQSKWTCTLFKPVFLGEDEEEGGRGCVYGSNKHGVGMVPQKIQLTHVSMGEEYLVSESMELVKKADETQTTTTTLAVSDVTPTAELPMYVTFKRHDGSKFLGSIDWYGLHFQFSDMADQGVAMVNRSAGKGPTDVSIFSGNKTEGGCWVPNVSADPFYIQLSSDIIGTFTPVKVKDYVALYNPSTQRFLQRDPDSVNGDCLSAVHPKIKEEAQLVVGEPVLERTIMGVVYDLDNARVYGTGEVTMLSDSRSNSTDHQDTGSLSKDYTMSRTMKWEQSITTSIGMSMSMTLGIPELGFGGEININYSFSGTCTWGEEDTVSETVSHVFNYDIPPWTKQTKKVVTSRAKCDVPFSYDVVDLLVDGTTHRYTAHGGVFTGANQYDAQEKTYDEPIPH